LLLRLLVIGQPVALQRDEFFYVFSKNGVERYPGNTKNWDFQFKGKLWALSDSTSGSKIPCQSFRVFSQMRYAYIVQATTPAEEWWKEWQKDCDGQHFIMGPLTVNEAKALRWAIIASSSIH
jgi:hypothetical protein